MGLFRVSWLFHYFPACIGSQYFHWWESLVAWEERWEERKITLAWTSWIPGLISGNTCCLPSRAAVFALASPHPADVSLGSTHLQLGLPPWILPLLIPWCTQDPVCITLGNSPWHINIFDSSGRKLPGERPRAGKSFSNILILEKLLYFPIFLYRETEMSTQSSAQSSQQDQKRQLGDQAQHGIWNRKP